MKIKKSAIILLLIANLFNLSAQNNVAATKSTKMQWWSDARFGMFIHFGVYAQWEGLYHGNKMKKGGAEWIMNRCKISVQEYKDTAMHFNPSKYDAEAWVKMAKDAGMKYIVITTKHHDGFAMFDSKASDLNIVKATAYKKDFLTPLANACRKNGMKIGFYYSQAQDWNNPGGSAVRTLTNEGWANEGWANPDSARIDKYTAQNRGLWDLIQTTRTMEQYFDNVAIPQIKEILTNYGDVAVLWWDTPMNMTDEMASKATEVLKNYPNLITNDRLKRPNFKGDFKTAEQKIPNKDELNNTKWETCMTMNETWGYKKYDDKWKSTETLVRNLIDVASKNGNFMLNIGPKPDGTFPQESVDRLKQIGQWMKINSEAIYGTNASPFAELSWGRCTQKIQKGNTILYLSVFNRPADGKLQFNDFKNKVLSCELLERKTKLNYHIKNDVLEINLPEKLSNSIATVIKVVVKGDIKKPL